MSQPTILQTIVAHKRQEVAARRALVPVKLLETSLYFKSQPLSLRRYLLREGGSGLIAEFKRKSPSKGWINQYAPVERTTLGYMQAGAAALSILTDGEFFGGKSEDLTTARRAAAGRIQPGVAAHLSLPDAGHWHPLRRGPLPRRLR